KTTTEPLSVPAQLAFTVSPSFPTSGMTIKPAIQVAIEDGFGNTVAGATNAVTVRLGSNSTGATLSGTTTVNAVDGVAVFNDLSINGPSASYALSATSDQLTSATSASFTLSAPASALHVTITTTGTSVASSYNLSIDCDSYGCIYAAPISPNGAVTVNVSSGNHYVELDVADNCTVSGDAARTITVSGLTDVQFAVTCAATGTLTITTPTGGTDISPDPYAVCVDRSGNACYWHTQARANDAVSISGIFAGPHTVTLNGVGGNCAVSGGATRAVTIPASGTVNAPFDLTCSLVER